MISKDLIQKLAINLDFKVYEVLSSFADERIALLNRQLHQSSDTTAMFRLQGQIQELQLLKQLKGIVEEALNR